MDEHGRPPHVRHRRSVNCRSTPSPPARKHRAHYAARAPCSASRADASSRTCSGNMLPRSQKSFCRDVMYREQASAAVPPGGKSLTAITRSRSFRKLPSAPAQVRRYARARTSRRCSRAHSAARAPPSPATGARSRPPPRAARGRIRPGPSTSPRSPFCARPSIFARAGARPAKTPFATDSSASRQPSDGVGALPVWDDAVDADGGARVPAGGGGAKCSAARALARCTLLWRRER
jgi:hypothetical protein